MSRGELGEVATELVQHQGTGLALSARSRRPVVAEGLSPEPGARGAAAGTAVAGEQLDDLLAHAGEVCAELHQDLGGHALALANEAEEDVLGADVVVAELEGLAEADSSRTFLARGE